MHRKQIGFSGWGLVVAGIGMSSINHRGSMWFFGQQVNRANVARRVKQFKLSWVEKGQDSVQVGLARGMLKFKLMLCLHRCLHPATYSRVFDALLMYYALLLKHTKLFWVVQGIKVELKFKLVACLHWCLEPAAHS